MAEIIKTDGMRQPVQPANGTDFTLEEMQAIVGGDIELVDVVDNKVFVSLRGACSSCRASAVTLKDVVESTLKEHVDGNITVVQA